MKPEEIVNIAKSYIGKTEKPNNSGFTDLKFEQRMKDVGWEKYLAWCSFFCELVWKESCCDKTLLAVINKNFSGSATSTFKNFDLDKTFKTGVEPKLGALIVFRYGNSWQGHIAIVTEVVDKTTVKTVEGNTNDKGGREGYIVASKTRLIKKPYTPTGLNFVGFVYP